MFCVISRYHGGAFVVFSKALNPNMTVLALEGSFASVLGGAPAAAVVFSARGQRAHRGRPAGAGAGGRARPRAGADRAALTARLGELRAAVRAEKLGEVATEFDRVHSIQRAVEVGSVDAVIRAARAAPAHHRGHRIGLGTGARDRPEHAARVAAADVPAQRRADIAAEQFL